MGLVKTLEHQESCVHDYNVFFERPYSYTRTYIEYNLLIGYFLCLIPCLLLVTLVPCLFYCWFSTSFLKRVSGPKNNSAILGALYLGWYWNCIYITFVISLALVKRYRMDVMWCFDMPHTYRDHPTSMRTEISFWTKPVTRETKASWADVIPSNGWMVKSDAYGPVYDKNSFDCAWEVFQGGKK